VCVALGTILCEFIWLASYSRILFGLALLAGWLLVPAQTIDIPMYVLIRFEMHVGRIQYANGHILRYILDISISLGLVLVGFLVPVKRISPRSPPSDSLRR
jgi:hypothetical protein